ncbi:MAG: hypothetical protein CMI53_00405 [Parcubacteria group bacterium]|nr:hypothetical protein [Parcubacteria group bacterium]|tara:strand:- start:2973 stop:3254 length:282 start_codon:yes stop_codon:yes gene_type:complete
MHSTDLSPTIDLDGNIGLAITSSSVSESWAVVFECEHGKFVIQGAKEKHEALWNKLSEGQEVTVQYREEYRVVYEGEEVMSRELVDYDFLDAE